MESLNLQVVAVLMPLEIKHHTIPHFKALTGSIDHASRQRRSSTFEAALHCFENYYFTLQKDQTAASCDGMCT